MKHINVVVLTWAWRSAAFLHPAAHCTRRQHRETPPPQFCLARESVKERERSGKSPLGGPDYKFLDHVPVDGSPVSPQRWHWLKSKRADRTIWTGGDGGGRGGGGAGTTGDDGGDDAQGVRRRILKSIALCRRVVDQRSMRYGRVREKNYARRIERDWDGEDTTVDNNKEKQEGNHSVAWIEE